MHVCDNVRQRHELLTWLNIQMHVCIFEVLQLEGSFIGDLLCRLHWGWKRQNLADEVSSTVVHSLACLVINMSFYASDSVSTQCFPLSIISLLTYRSQWSLSLSLSLSHSLSHTHTHTQTHSKSESKCKHQTWKYVTHSLIFVVELILK